MFEKVCRLCLGDQKLVNIFDKRLINSDSLRKCILLASGVEIYRNDRISKYVCKNCSDISISLYIFRQNALANDKALKESAKCKLVIPPLYKMEITKFKQNLLNLLKAKRKEQRINGDIEINPNIDRTEISHSMDNSKNILIQNVENDETLYESDAESCSSEHDNENLSTSIISEEEVPTILGDVFGLNSGNIKDIVPNNRHSPEFNCEGRPKDVQNILEDVFGSNSGNIKNIVANKRKSPELNCESRIFGYSDKITKELEAPVINSLDLIPNLNTQPLTNHEVQLELRKVATVSPNNQPTVSTSPKHSENKLEFNCEHCNKRFRSKRQLNCHGSVHRKCSICEDSSNTNGDLTCYQKPIFAKDFNALRMINGIPVSSCTRTSPNSSLNVEIGRREFTNQKEETSYDNQSLLPSISTNNRCKSSTKTDFVKLEISQTKSPRFHTDLGQSNARIKVNDDKRMKQNDIDLTESIVSKTSTIGGYSLLETFQVEPVFSCNTCCKLFDSPWKLKCHNRFHKHCVLCKGVFGSNKALKHHQKEICFKKIGANLPNVRLRRLDEDVDAVKQWPQVLAISEMVKSTLP